ncbi:hypothetical protein AB3662_40660 [Sorangium cellulosum]|uniref:hypothetical protein n=1 Tax=Sorangium cellulosum TaxID=56 RepID=UPI003D9A8303
MSTVRDGLKICCAAAVTLAAVQAGATEPPPGPAPQVSPPPPGPLAPAALTAAAPPHGWSPGAWQTASGGVDARPQVKRVWYGWQHLIVFAGSAVIAPAAVAFDAPELLILSFSGLVVGGPVVHAAHGHTGKSVASLGLNVGGVIFGGMIGAVASRGADEGDFIEPGVGGFILGGTLGLLATNIVDIVALPYEEKVRKPESHVANRLRLAPQIGFAPRGATFGFGGTF